MLAYIRKVKDYGTDEGASAVEYGLLIAAIAAVIIGVVFAIGQLVNDGFTSTCNALDNGSTTNSADC